jgi:GT2 family glycosyltransferase
MDISVLIVCYHSLADIQNCLNGLYSNTKDITFEVILLDNSKDGTVDWVISNYPQAHVIPNNSNLGFAGGNNLLARHATGKFLLLLNPDTLILDNSVKRLLECAERYPQHGAWGGITLHVDGARENSSLQAAPTIWNMFLLSIGLKNLRTGVLQDGSKTEHEVAILSGAFMLVNRKIWDELGGFDSSYFLYSEEVDLCYRIAQQTGLSPIMTPHASVTHLVGRSCKDSTDRILGILRGRMHFDRKFHGVIHNTAMATLIVWNALIRLLFSILLQLFIGQDRAKNIRNKYKPVIFHISDWWHGYNKSR